jgi:lysophospholipase L1-like esterase
VYFLGDSVMLGARSAIMARLPGWHVRFDAEVNRSTYRAIDIVRANRAAFRDVAVVQLGTNDAGTPSVFSVHATELLAELRGLPLVVWLTIRHARPYYAVADGLLVKDLAATSHGVVADWDAVQPPGGAGPDGLHLNAVGASAMAGLVDGVLTRWRDTGRGTGDTRCARRAERLATSHR